MLSIGLVGMLVFAGMKSHYEGDVPNWNEIGGMIATYLCIIGALVLWGYAFRFYCRIQTTLGVVRSSAYLLIVICLSWLSPIAFMIIEGRDRFFEVALD
jgi:hypothetical protein